MTVSLVLTKYDVPSERRRVLAAATLAGLVDEPLNETFGWSLDCLDLFTLLVGILRHDTL